MQRPPGGERARRAVFLDRDGVLIEAVVQNSKPFAIDTASDIKFLPGAREACAELSSLGYLLVMITNQPDVARGKISSAFVHETNAHIAAALGLDDVQVCMHDDSDNCACRKPKPGMIINAARQLNIDLPRSFAVGDRWRDIGAGRAAGCTTVLVDYGYDERLQQAPDHIVPSLGAAVPWIRART